ncbi:MAG: hypothetical protein PVS2B2_26080 [Candidatus Acidiferrum sp.]
MSATDSGAVVDSNSSVLFMGYDPSMLDREGLMNEVSPGGDINFPWLIAVCTQMGNAYTTGLATTANVFCEPEWGFESAGVGKTQPGGLGMSLWW